MSQSPLERSFHTSMLDIYKRANSEAGYNATRFLSMVAGQGGLLTAKQLLHASTVSEGYTALWEKGRLDLSVEALVLEERWHVLFTDDERAIARSRLAKYGYRAKGPNT